MALLKFRDIEEHLSLLYGKFIHRVWILFVQAYPNWFVGKLFLKFRTIIHLHLHAREIAERLDDSYFLIGRGKMDMNERAKFLSRPWILPGYNWRNKPHDET